LRERTSRAAKNTSRSSRYHNVSASEPLRQSRAILRVSPHFSQPRDFRGARRFSDDRMDGGGRDSGD